MSRPSAGPAGDSLLYKTRFLQAHHTRGSHSHDVLEVLGPRRADVLRGGGRRVIAGDDQLRGLVPAHVDLARQRLGAG